LLVEIEIAVVPGDVASVDKKRCVEMLPYGKARFSRQHEQVVVVELEIVVRATGAVMAPLAVLAVSMLGVRFPLAEILISRYQVDAIWWSFPISSALAAALAVLYYKYGNWRSARMVGGPRQGIVAPSPEG